MIRSVLAGRSAAQRRWIHSAVRLIALTPLRPSVVQNNNPLLRLPGNQWSTSFGRNFSGPEPVNIGPEQNLSYEEFKALVEEGKCQLFDVRGPSECQNTMLLGHAVNIPMNEFAAAFFMSPEEFKEKYGVKKPDKDDDDIVFYCLRGVRSSGAIAMLQCLGYKKSRHFPGGWGEWESRMKH